MKHIIILIMTIVATHFVLVGLAAEDTDVTLDSVPYTTPLWSAADPFGLAVLQTTTSRVTTVEGRATGLENRVTAVESLTNLTPRVTAVESLTNLTPRVTAVENRTTAVESLTNLTPRVTAVENRTTGLEGRATGLEGRTNDWNTAYSWGDFRPSLVPVTNSIANNTAAIEAVQARTNDWNLAHSWGDWNPTYTIATGRLAQVETKTNDWNAAAALGETALQPSWAATGTVFRATEVIGAQSTLIETAWQNPANAANWTWTSNGKEITLTGYSGPAAVVIPDMLDGLPVTGFGTIFTGDQNITSVSGGQFITEIGDGAFEFAASLTTANFPQATTIGDGAFAGTSLTTANFPQVTTIGDFAFVGTPLTSLYLGQNAPAEAQGVFDATPNVTVYVTDPTATGYGATWNGRPVVRMPLSADKLTLKGTNIEDRITAEVNAAAATADAKYVAKAGFPAGGCTDISASGIISGATVNYFVASTTNWTLSVSESAPRYNYHVRVLSTNAVMFAGMTLFGSYAPGGTNSIVVGAYTGTTWQAQGGVSQ